MESGPPIVVVDPNDWHPGYGESNVEVYSRGRDWIIDITYDHPKSGKPLKRSLQFHSVDGFHYASTPGVQLLNINHQKSLPTVNLGALFEYPESEAALAWSRYWQQAFGSARATKHYRIWFLQENISIVVFAESVSLTEPIPA